MPLDFWIARTNSFESILSPSPAGPIPHEEVLRIVDALELQKNPTDNHWVLDSEDRPLATLELVAVGDSDIVRLGVAMATSGFAARCRSAWKLASDLAERLDANAFEATAGRGVTGDVSGRYVESREREAIRVTDRLAPNGLAPLEFAVENLDAVANVLTVVSNHVIGLPEENWVHGVSERGNTARWRWENAPFTAALRDLRNTQANDLARDGATLDARKINPKLVELLESRNDRFYAAFYLHWRNIREEFANA